MSNKKQEKLITICGKEEKEIRKAYFKGQKDLLKLLNEIQAEEKWSEKEVLELGKFLEELRTGDQKFIKDVQSVFGGKIIDEKISPPSVEELREGVEYSDEWADKANKAIDYATNTLDKLRIAIANKEKISPDYWLQTASILISYLPVIWKEFIYRKQRYYERITKIIDNQGCSRLEAENRAKLTSEYKNYKELEIFVGDGNKTGILERFENLAKKNDSKNNKF